jgi:FAD/FMN-containing dehydrogenase
MDVNGLRPRIAGEVIAATDPRFEPLCCELVWNRLLHDRRPAGVVRVATDGDVVEAVRFARENGLGVTARGGGHHWSGAALRHGTLLVDLARLNELRVDGRRAAAQPAVTNGEFARRLEPLGLAFPYGHCASVEAVEVVLASGAKVTADANRHADLFWAARGAGAAFPGIVTRYHLRLYGRPRRITRAASFYPLGRAAEVARWAAGEAAGLPACVELTLVLGAAPPELADACAGDNGMCCVVDAVAFADTGDEAAAALAFLGHSPLRDAALRHAPAVPATFAELLDGIGLAFPEGHRYLADAFWFEAEPGDLAVRLARALAAAPSRKSLALGLLAPPRHVGDFAFAPQGRLFALCYAIWDDAADDAENRAWHRSAVDVLEPLVVGHYVGEADLARANRIERSFAPDVWQRLREITARYDPTGLFVPPL